MMCLARKGGQSGGAKCHTVIDFVLLIGSMAKAKTLLKGQPLLAVLDEFISHVSHTSTDATALLHTSAKRHSLVSELREKKRQRVSSVA